MIRFACLCVLSLSILTLPACNRRQGGSPGASIPEEQPKSSALESDEQPKSNEVESGEHTKYSNDLIAEKSWLSYNGYSIVKRKKKFRYEYPIEMQSKPDLIDVFYTVLKRNGKILAEFNEFYYGIGNSNDTGLFPFLGGHQSSFL